MGKTPLSRRAHFASHVPRTARQQMSGSTFSPSHGRAASLVNAHVAIAAMARSIQATCRAPICRRAFTGPCNPQPPGGKQRRSRSFLNRCLATSVACFTIEAAAAGWTEGVRTVSVGGAVHMYVVNGKSPTGPNTGWCYGGYGSIRSVPLDPLDPAQPFDHRTGLPALSSAFISTRAGRVDALVAVVPRNFPGAMAISR